MRRTATLPTSAGTDILVKVLAFARLRELLGFSERAILFPDGTSVAGAWDAIVAESAEARALRGAIRIARNGAIARDDTPLAAGDELALLPPVSGG